MELFNDLIHELFGVDEPFENDFFCAAAAGLKCKEISKQTQKPELPNSKLTFVFRESGAKQNLVVRLPLPALW
jgi:hypothetical protein